MKSIIIVTLAFCTVFSAIRPKVDIHAFSKLSFLVTHSWEHLSEDGFSLWQLIDHYIDEWDAESHQPVNHKQETPVNCFSCNYFTAFFPVIEYFSGPAFSESVAQKYIPYRFSLSSGYNGSIFHPPKY